MENHDHPSLGYLLWDAGRLLRRRFEQECRDIPMTSAQLQIIGRLKHNEGIGQAALAALLDLEPMTLSRHVDRMEAAGLVERRPDPQDRRARQLFTTEKSRGLLTPMRERAVGVYEQVQAGLSDDERATLVAALSTIIANLSDAETDTGRGILEGSRMNAQVDRKELEAAAPLATDGGPAAKPGRSRRRLLIAALPLVLAIVGGYVWVTGGRFVATEDAYVKQDRISVVPQVTAPIARVMVAENDVVAVGQTLFTLDDAAFRNTVEQDQAKLESARLGVERLKAAYAQAQSEAATARDALATAETRDARQQSLLKSGVSSQASADDTALALQQAHGALAQAESRVLSARAALAGDPDIVTDDHPAVLEALAELHAAELDLSHTVVTAPRAGVVSQTARLQEGQYVTPTVPVLTLVATDDTWIEANYKETDLTHMQPGQGVEVRLDTYPDHRLAGEIGSIGAGTGSEFAILPAQNASGNWVKVVQRVPIRIRLADGQDLPPLRAGMSATVEADTGHARGLPRVVEGALAALGLGGQPAVAAPSGK